MHSLQGLTAEIVATLASLCPEAQLNDFFLQIINEGTGKTFTTAANANWLAATRPILEAFFHARFFLEMIVRYGKALNAPPQALPSGWAAVLYLYNLR